jgi:3',5'-cyclic AMP phosphodiesterase CpdA
MRIAIISDIHGNLPALDAVLADVAQQQPDRLYCLGDLVGYGASPNETGYRNRGCASNSLAPTSVVSSTASRGFLRDHRHIGR